MGRKIPAKKHHGVKDPEKQAEQRNAKIKLKINETPVNIDDQEIPKKIKNLFKPNFKRKNKGPTHDNPPLQVAGKSKKDIDSKYLPQRPLKQTPSFNRIPGESDRDYLWRSELVTRNYLKKQRFEDKYDVDVETDYTTGEVDIKKRSMKFIDDVGVQVEPQDKWEKKKFKKMEKLKKEREERKQLKKEKFKMRKLYKKNKKLGKQDDFSILKQDKVEFGDVAQQPPQLTAKPRKSSATQRPGNRSLLLKSTLVESSTTSKPSSSNLSGKRKDLSALDRHKLEEERLRVVELYREMQKLKNANRA